MAVASVGNTHGTLNITLCNRQNLRMDHTDRIVLVLMSHSPLGCELAPAAICSRTSAERVTALVIIPGTAL
jgi:hypothetical protein